jgi:ribosomal protein S27AE
MNWFKDKFGRWWRTENPLEAFCPQCGQPDTEGECNHRKIPEDEVKELGGLLKKPRGKIYSLTLQWVEVKNLRDIYPKGECPDCGKKIPAKAREGDECGNCGHVFYLA